MQGYPNFLLKIIKILEKCRSKFTIITFNILPIHDIQHMQKLLLYMENNYGGKKLLYCYGFHFIYQSKIWTTWVTTNLLLSKYMDILQIVNCKINDLNNTRIADYPSFFDIILSGNMYIDKYDKYKYW